ncbi:hypothetical protein N7517_008089 [Penicillium concentricum]|uniref:Uncharacterized protein n=1 Tax=Penicillium concentricum TaxID=293559 RepID=A0A9W9RWN9_9EURO|nr:uncharacterized protein N7517_008089 [Penicillium concentricum]KAJ5365203.1 hypothetical protein N7517_008089 [Penicillium concentricum]
MAVFQQPPSATLPPPSTTHYTTHHFMPQAAISCALTLISSSTTPTGEGEGRRKWPPSAPCQLHSGHLPAAMAINIPFPPILRPTLSSFRLKHHSKNLPLIFRRAFFYSVVSCVDTSRAPR